MHAVSPFLLLSASLLLPLSSAAFPVNHSASRGVLERFNAARQEQQAVWFAPPPRLRIIDDDASDHVDAKDWSLRAELVMDDDSPAKDSESIFSNADPTSTPGRSRTVELRRTAVAEKATATEKVSAGSGKKSSPRRSRKNTIAQARAATTAPASESAKAQSRRKAASKRAHPVNPTREGFLAPGFPFVFTILENAL